MVESWRVALSAGAGRIQIGSKGQKGDGGLGGVILWPSGAAQVLCESHTGQGVLKHH